MGSKYETVDPEFARKVKNHFYVDDLNTGVRSTQEGSELYHNMKSRFSEAGFNLRKWRTNDVKLREVIDDAEISEGRNEKLAGNQDKILGIIWDHLKDELKIDVKDALPTAEIMKPTKRNVIKFLASIYDPIEFLQALAIRFQILFQRICRFGTKWDDETTGDILLDWNELLRPVHSMKEINIRRCYYTTKISEPVVSTVLHGFSDASQLAYAACVYLKTTRRSGEVDVCLVTSKSRVIPMNKTYTIPRLELLGNLVLSKLMFAVMRAFESEIVIDDCHYWTDSQISLAWIKANDN